MMATTEAALSSSTTPSGMSATAAGVRGAFVSDAVSFQSFEYRAPIVEHIRRKCTDSCRTHTYTDANVSR
jgi:hypothetical protein